MVVLHVVQALVTPPPRYPDLITLFITSYSCLHFVGMFLYCVWSQVALPHPQFRKVKDL
jgi:hypothetical protein